MKGMAFISEAILLAVTVVMVFLVYTMSAPAIASMQASSTFEQTKSAMLSLDSAIQNAASQGKGSRSTLYVTSGAGVLELDSDRDMILWTLSTDANVVSKRSMSKAGNMVSGENLRAAAYENESEGVYVLENDRLIVHILKVGSESSHAYYNTSDLLVGVYNKDLGSWMGLSRLDISLDGSPMSQNGTGYTQLSAEGYALPRGEVMAHMASGYEYMENYTIIFSLEAGADFITIEAEEQF
jgi:hypothetical protein